MPDRGPLLSLVAIFTVAWILVLGGVLLIFDVIIPFQYCQCFYDSAAKGVASAVLSLAWLYVLVLMRDLFVKRNIVREKSEVAGRAD